MATCTLSYQLCPKKADGTFPVRIRMTYCGSSRYYKTSIVVTQREVTPQKKIKRGATLLRIEEMLTNYRKIINDLYLEVNDYSMDSLYNKVFNYSSAEQFDFIAWADGYCTKHKDKPQVRTHHRCALNSFKKYKGEKVMVTDMTSKVMRGFEESLRNAGKTRAVSSYTSSIKSLFKLMRDEFNDYDCGLIAVKDTMAGYTPPKEKPPAKRSLTREEIIKIFKLPYDNVKNSRGMGSRRDLALDCFRLSFCLMGTNSADLFLASDFDGTHIIYNRQKTKDRRDDEAEIKIEVLPVIRKIFDRYRDRSGKRVFNFYKRFKNYQDFNKAINKGLKDVGEEIGVDRLTYYAARHSMATIAVNEAKVDKHIVSDMLNHVESSLRVTNIYLQKDFRPINEANKQLMDYVFNNKTMNKEELDKKFAYATHRLGGLIVDAESCSDILFLIKQEYKRELARHPDDETLQVQVKYLTEISDAAIAAFTNIKILGRMANGASEVPNKKYCESKLG